MRQSMSKPGLGCSLPKPVIAWVLPEKRRIKVDAEEVSTHIVSNRCAEPFSIARSSLTVGGIITVHLRSGSVPRRADIVQRISGALHEHVELIRGRERAGPQIAFVARNVHCGALDPL
jgi:hypothetical protein